MTLTSTKQARRMGAAIALAGALAALGWAPAQAQTFVNASISIEPRGEAAGGLTCRWRETGLGSSQVVYYSCGAAAVHVLKACVYKNRLIYNSPTRLDAFTNIIGGEHGGYEPFLSQKNGQIHVTTTTTIPELETETEMCIEPSAEAVTAVRWCGAWLTDITNGVVGTTVGELYEEFVPTPGVSVPACPQ